MTDDELYVDLREQIDEIGEPEGVVCCPDEISDEQFDRVMKRIEDDLRDSIQ